MDVSLDSQLLGYVPGEVLGCYIKPFETKLFSDDGRET